MAPRPGGLGFLAGGGGVEEESGVRDGRMETVSRNVMKRERNEIKESYMD